MPKHLPREHNRSRRHCPLDEYGAHGRPGLLMWVVIDTRRRPLEIPLICVEHLGIVLGGSYLLTSEMDRIRKHQHSKEVSYGTESE